MTCLDVVRAAQLRAGPVRGDEHAFHCPGPGHRNGDEHASLFINTKKNCAMCGPCGFKGTAWQVAAFLAGVEPSDKPAVLAWLSERRLTPGNGAKPRIVATYGYTDEADRLLYEVVRYEPKDFKQRRPDGHGGWSWNLNGARRVLYHLPEMLRSVDIVVVEGEKDADNLSGIGLTATCNPGGAGKWRPEYTEFFKPHQRVVIMPDNDEPGRKHAQQVAVALHGKVASVKVLQLPGLPEKGDVSGWLAAGGTREGLETLVDAAPEFVPAESEETGKMCFTRLGDLLNEPDEQVRWLVEEHLPAGGDSLLVGKPKAGKSTLARCLALAVARGEEFLGFKTVQGPVLYLALEEKRAEVRRHFIAMGARDDDPIFIFCATSPADGLEQLRAAAKNHGPVLIIVDPLFRFTRVKDGNDYAAVTSALEPLHALARDSGAHVLAGHHLGKGDRQGGDAVLGSTALFAAVDTLLIMKRSDKYRTLSSIQRYGADLEEITLEYDSEARTINAGVSLVEADLREMENVILEFLSTQVEAVDERAITGIVEGRKGVKVKALRRLVDSRKVVRTGGGKKGDPYLYRHSGFLVPTIFPEPENRNPKQGLTDSYESANTGSAPCAQYQDVPGRQEPAFSNAELEQFDV